MFSVRLLQLGSFTSFPFPPSLSHFHTPTQLPLNLSSPNNDINSHKLSTCSLIHREPKPKPFLQTPFSALSPKIHLPIDDIIKSLSRNIVFCLLGSFIFMGFIGLRPSSAYALHSGISTSDGSSFTSSSKTGETESEEDEMVMHERLLEKEPDNVEALKVIVYNKMRGGKTSEAVKYVEKLIDIETEEVEWRLLQALCYEMMGELSKSKRLFKEILEERPLLLRALHGLAMVMHKKHEGPAVFEMLNKALKLAHDEKRVTEERNIQILIAQMLVVQGDLETGLRKFQELVNENPRDFRPYLCQGIIYSLLDKKEEAHEQFEIYKSLVPDEFPNRGFLDDVVLEAKSKSRDQLQKEFQNEYSAQK